MKKIWFATEQGGANGDVLIIQNTLDDLLPRYLYHVLSDDRFFEYDMQNAKGSKMPRGDKKIIMKYQFSLPPLSEQKRIVATLDKFDTLTSNLTQGLPKEIKQRQRQYEYFRDKLLNFKK